MAYADTDVFDLWAGMQPAAMVFERTGGLWKPGHGRHPSRRPGLAGPVHPRSAPATPPVLAPGSYALDLARVLTSAATGAAPTAAAASPFAANDFLADTGSIPAQFATSIRQDRRGGVRHTGRFSPAPDPTFALPLRPAEADRGIGIMTQTHAYTAPAGLSAKDWPDGSQVATPRPAVVHDETDTFITTYTAIDPLRPGNTAVALDGFFG